MAKDMVEKIEDEAPKGVTDSIENWMRIKKTKDSVIAGTKALFNWKTGRVVTESEYDKAVDIFLKAPIG